MNSRSRLRRWARWLFTGRRTPGAAGRIFLCYRWDDTEGSVGRIQEHLEQRFGEARVFRDIKIHPGEDYRDAVRRELATSYAVLVVIGRRWLTSLDDEGRRRIDYANDALRVEVEFALEHDAHIRVIPVLVEGAQMPRPMELPASIHRLAYRVAHVLSNQHWRTDAERLIGRLETPRPDRFGRWPDIRPRGTPLLPLIVNALLRPYWTNVLVPVGLVVAGFLLTPWLWIFAAAFYVGSVVTTLFDLQQARWVRDYVEERRPAEASSG